MSTDTFFWLIYLARDLGIKSWHVLLALALLGWLIVIALKA